MHAVEFQRQDACVAGIGETQAKARPRRERKRAALAEPTDGEHIAEPSRAGPRGAVGEILPQGARGLDLPILEQQQNIGLDLGIFRIGDNEDAAKAACALLGCSGRVCGTEGEEAGIARRNAKDRLLGGRERLSGQTGDAVELVRQTHAGDMKGGGRGHGVHQFERELFALAQLQHGARQRPVIAENARRLRRKRSQRPGGRGGDQPSRNRSGRRLRAGRFAKQGRRHAKPERQVAARRTGRR